MSEPGNADLFKSRLAQLKKVLEREAKIAENLFYAALQLDKNKELKSGVQEIIDKHKMKAKKGYLYLPDDEKDRPAAVKALLKDAFDFLLKAFNVEKSSLVQRKASEPKVHALQLFELQSTLEAGASAQARAFESTMEDLDSIDTSTPLEQMVIVPPPSDGEEQASVEPTVPKMPASKEIPSVPKPPVQPIVVSKLAVSEQITGEKVQGQKPAVTVLSPGSGTRQKLIPLPPKIPPQGNVAASPPATVEVKAVIATPVPSTKPASTPVVVPVVKPAPKPTSMAKPSPVPASAPSHVAPSPISYEYYVCNRCGEETSKSAIRQIGTYLECPKCKFNFSRAEATIIQKAAPASEQAAKSRSEEEKKPFDIYSSKMPGEDESLIRPSALFADREKETKNEKLVRPSALFGNKEKEAAPPVKRLSPAKIAEVSRPKPRPVPSDRLVRPSEVLGLKEERPDSEAEKIVKNEAAEYFSEEKPAESAPRPAPAVTEKIAQSPASEYFEEGVVPALTAKPVPRTLAPTPPPEPPVKAVTTAADEPPSPGDTCPKCGATKYSRIQDRNKVISYNPLMYGYKKKCTMCLFEFD